MSKPLDIHDATGVLVNIPGVGIMQAYGTSVPSDAAVGYATGCIFHKTDGGDGTSLYVNEGDITSADFNAITVA